MNSSSLREYFYKLANRCYLLILLPLGVFIYLYYQFESKKITPYIKDESITLIILAGIVVLSLIYLTTVHWLSRKRLKKYSAEVGLGRKLDRYYEIVMFRYSACSSSSLMMALGLLFTGNELFGIFFMGILLWIMLQWPTTKRTCRDLDLKGDEYEMVLFKKDKFF
jgi:hypothetical protein